MKKLLGVILSASVLTLTGCGKQEAPATDAAQSKDAKWSSNCNYGFDRFRCRRMALYRDPA